MPAPAPSAPVPPSAPPADQHEPGGVGDLLPAPPLPPAYRGLRAWQRALALAVAVHRLSRTLPADEQDALAAELRRTALGIPGAIAAGSAVWERGEYVRALVAAQGLLARLETIVALGEQLGLVQPDEERAVLLHTAEVRRLLAGLARATRSRGAAPPEPADAPLPEPSPIEAAPSPGDSAPARGTAAGGPTPPSMRRTRRRGPGVTG